MLVTVVHFYAFMNHLKLDAPLFPPYELKFKMMFLTALRHRLSLVLS